MRRDEWWPDVRDLAEDQGGLFTAAQARRAGARRPQIADLLQLGAVDRVQHGVYHLIGSPIDQWQAARAAWLALDPETPAAQRIADPAGPGGVISHHTAARMLNLGDISADRIDLAVPTRRTTRNRDVRIHTASLDRDDWTSHAGLPLTRPAVTIAMLAADGIGLGHLASIVRDAALDHHTDTTTLAARLEPHARSYGYPDGESLLDYLLEQAGTPAVTVDVAARSVADQFAQVIANNPAVTEQLQRTVSQMQLTQALHPPPLPDTSALRAAVGSTNAVNRVLNQNRDQLNKVFGDTEALSRAYRAALANSPARASITRLHDQLAQHTIRQIAKEALRPAQDIPARGRR